MDAAGTRGPRADALSSRVDLHLKSGKDRPVRFGHPWVFSGALREGAPAVEPGTVVRLLASDGECLGRGYYHPSTQIAVRMLTRADEEIDASFFARRLDAAIALRRAVVAADTDAYRLVNGEGDGLPGFVVDRYGETVVVQCLTAGAERQKKHLIDALIERLEPRCVYERSAGSVRQAEGLEPVECVWHGAWPERFSVRENGLLFAVDPSVAQKTGLFLDQRDNHAICRGLAAGRTVLDAFCYTGGFAVAAGAGGARRVVAVDSSARAVERARGNWTLNGLPEDGAEFVQADVQRHLRQTRDRFDLLVVDPPAFVKRRSEAGRGARAYKDVNLWAFGCAAPGALLLTFTCSQHVTAELFRKIVAGAATDAKRDVQVLRPLGPGPDHPVGLGHPEGEYLHGLLLRVQ